MYVGTYMLQGTCGGQRKTVWNWFSPATFTWVPGLELRSPRLFSKCLSLWTTMVATSFEFLVFLPLPYKFYKCVIPHQVITLVLQTLSSIYLWSWNNNTQISHLHWRRVIACPSSDFKSTKAVEFSHRATKPSLLFWCFTHSSCSNQDPPPPSQVSYWK